jgi:hypothetical protein
MTATYDQFPLFTFVLNPTNFENPIFCNIHIVSVDRKAKTVLGRLFAMFALCIALAIFDLQLNVFKICSSCS